MSNKKSDYALNKKNKEAIISRNAEGEIIHLTKDEFASEEEFVRWKEWSDNEYRQEYNARQSHKRLKKKLQKLTEEIQCSISAEQLLISAVDKTANQDFINKIKACLTERQFKRLWLYYMEGMTEQQIAEVEGISQQNIAKSLKAARKKLKKSVKKLDKAYKGGK